MDLSHFVYKFCLVYRWPLHRGFDKLLRPDALLRPPNLGGTPNRQDARLRSEMLALEAWNTLRPKTAQKLRETLPNQKGLPHSTGKREKIGITQEDCRPRKSQLRIEGPTPQPIEFTQFGPNPKLLPDGNVPPS